MFTVLATRLALTITDPATSALEHSQPVNLEGANAVNFDLTVYNINGTFVVTAQFSNDLENWVDDLSSVTPTAPGYWGSSAAGGAGAALNALGFQYARLEYLLTQADGDFVILASGMTTSNQ